VEIQIDHTDVFEWNYEAYQDNKRFILNQGGSRSSKSFSILQLLIVICLTEPNTSISIVRKSFPSLRSSIMRDWLEIMDKLNLYDVKCHNKTNNIYTFPNKSSIEFFSADESQKLRGRKRDILYCNEANELTIDDFTQLNIRTTKSIFIDFNPSDLEHFLYDLIKDERSILIKSTYKDNKFLSEDQIREIENLINVDYNYYKVYCLGEPPTSESRVYKHFKEFNDINIDWGNSWYGADWGYNHPTALIEITYHNNKYYIRELLFENQLTSTDIVNKFNSLDVNRTKTIYADYARPEIIEELRRSGFKVKEADKAVVKGINFVKKSEVYVEVNSKNIWREHKLYSYKVDRNNIVTEEILKINDDLMDSIRYAMMTHPIDRPKVKNIFF